MLIRVTRATSFSLRRLLSSAMPSSSLKCEVCITYWAKIRRRTEFSIRLITQAKENGEVKTFKEVRRHPAKIRRAYDRYAAEQKILNRARYPAPFTNGSGSGSSPKHSRKTFLISCIRFSISGHSVLDDSRNCPFASARSRSTFHARLGWECPELR
jgi:hypothetical protein